MYVLHVGKVRSILLFTILRIIYVDKAVGYSTDGFTPETWYELPFQGKSSFANACWLVFMPSTVAGCCWWMLSLCFLIWLACWFSITYPLHKSNYRSITMQSLNPYQRPRAMQLAWPSYPNWDGQSCSLTILATALGQRKDASSILYSPQVIFTWTITNQRPSRRKNPFRISPREEFSNFQYCKWATRLIARTSCYKRSWAMQVSVVLWIVGHLMVVMRSWRLDRSLISVCTRRVEVLTPWRDPQRTKAADQLNFPSMFYITFKSTTVKSDVLSGTGQRIWLNDKGGI